MSNIPSSLLEQDKMIIKKSLHLRNDSDELDVFEAARYFSGANELVLGAHLSQKSMKEQHVITTTTTTRLQSGGGGGRMSLDMPSSMRNSIPSHAIIEKTEMPITKEKIKFKQPSSPGGKLASFLNSLFNQTSSKKKKSKSTTQSMKDEDESPGGGGRRKRRSSISHFRSGSSNNIITTSTSDSKSIYSTTSSTTSGFRTPPPYGYTTTKCTYQKPAPLTGLTNGLTSGLTKPIVGLDEKFKFRDGFLEKNKNLGNGFLEKGRILAEKCQNEEREITFKRFDKEDDGGDSDSSSDLFELTNCDLGYYSSGLPVYETTHMDSIKRGVPISSGGPILI